MSPIFLSLDEILEIHEDQLSRYGGTSGILSKPVLESALAQPQATFDGKFLMADLFEMAAATCSISCRIIPLWMGTSGWEPSLPSYFCSQMTKTSV